MCYQREKAWLSKGARTGTGSQSEAPTNTKSLKSGRKSEGPFQTPPPPPMTEVSMAGWVFRSPLRRSGFEPIL